MKNKVILRAFLLLLAILMVIPFAGCENTPDPQETDPVTTPSTDPTDTDPAGTEPTDTDPTDTEPTEEGPALPEKNFNNREFTILIREHEQFTDDVYVKSIDAHSTSVERAVYQRLSDISSQFGMLFEALIEPTQALVSANSKSGMDVYEVVVDHGRTMLGSAASGYFYDWNNLPYVDLSADWWNQEAISEFSTPGGKLFTMLGDISYMSVGSAFCMFFNKALIDDVDGLVSPYDLVRDKAWDFAKFEEYATTVDSNLDGDGTGDIATDCFGYGTWYWRGPVQLLYSAGSRILRWDDDNWKITLDTDTTNEAVFDMRDLLFNSGSGVLSHEDSYVDLKAAFIEDRVVFMDGQVDEAGVFAGSDTSYGVLPWPKYNKRVKQYFSAVDAGTNLFGVMRNTSAENAEFISIILEAMAYEGYDKVLPLYFDTILSYQYLKDEDSIEMLHIIHDNLVIDFGYFYSKVNNLFPDVVTDLTLGSLTKALDEVEQAAIEDLWNKWNILDEEEDAVE